MKTRNIIISLLLVLGTTGTAFATTIGVAVNHLGTQLDGTLPAGLVLGGGNYGFYIPLKAGTSGIYGVNAGTTVDTCTFTGANCGGTLDMYFKFSPVTPGPNILSLYFNDLDLQNVNDPAHFLEAVSIYHGGTLLSTFTNINNAGATGNYNNQTLSFNIGNVPSSPFTVKLALSSHFGSGMAHAKWQNTIETVRTEITSVPVPEPTTLTLLGLGALALSLTRRRNS